MQKVINEHMCITVWRVHFTFH